MNFIAHFGLGVLERLSLRFENENWEGIGGLSLENEKEIEKIIS